MKRCFNVYAVLCFLCCMGDAAALECPDWRWGSRDLQIGVEGPKDYYGDTNIAYAIFSFDSNSSLDTVYRIKGELPNARYISIESSELVDIGSWDFDAIQDHQIVLDGEVDNSTNPFATGSFVAGESFTVDVVPDLDADDGAGLTGNEDEDYMNSSSAAANILLSPTNGNENQIWLRIVLPKLAVGDTAYPEVDLPTITALNLSNGQEKECPVGLLAAGPESAEVINGSDLGTPYAVGEDYLALSQSEPSLAATDFEGIDIEELILRLLDIFVTRKWSTFDFGVIEIPFEGSSAIPGYSYALTKMNEGDVAVIKLKAPEIGESGSPEVMQENDQDMRYWSVCSLDLAHGEGLACLADEGIEVDEDGYVTIVYGPNDASFQELVEGRGYKLLPDTRQSPDELVTFVYRQLLPSPEFAAMKLHVGEYVPRARVCSARWFKWGFCRVW